MSTKYSPFADIFETKTHPHARTLRTSFSQKLTDAFNIIAGDILIDTKRIGLFDYFTLFVPYLLIKANKWLDNSGYDTLSQVLFMTNLVILLTKLLVAAIGTILCLPIIASVHGISKLVAGQTYSEALDVRGTNERQEEMTLGNYLMKTKQNVEDFVSTYERTEENHYKITLTKMEEPSNSSFCFKIAQEDGVIKQAGNIHALFNLNIGRTTSNLENMPDESFNNNDKDFILNI